MGEANRAMGCGKTSGLFQAFLFFTQYLATQKKTFTGKGPIILKKEVYRGTYLEGLYTF